MTNDSNAKPWEIEARDRQRCAKNALHALGITISAVFIPLSVSRNAASKDGKAWQSLNWRVSVMRDGREFLSVDYSVGAGHAPASKRDFSGAFVGHGIKAVRAMRERAVAWECEHGREVLGRMICTGRSNGHWRPLTVNTSPLMPEAVDVLASLTMDTDVLEYSSFEEWAESLGFDTDSRSAEATYRECLRQALALRVAIGEAGLATLREVFAEW